MEEMLESRSNQKRPNEILYMKVEDSLSNTSPIQKIQTYDYSKEEEQMLGLKKDLIQAKKQITK